MNVVEEAIQMNVLQIGEKQQVYLVAYLFQQLPVTGKCNIRCSKLNNKPATEAHKTIESMKVNLCLTGKKTSMAPSA